MGQTIMVAMLRIRLPSGNIRDFAGSEELARAIAAGEVDTNAEIYHAKSGRWVSVTGHPVFRRVGIEAPPPPQSEPETSPAPDVLAIPASPESVPTPQEESTSPHGEHEVGAAIPLIEAVPSVTPVQEPRSDAEAGPVPDPERKEPRPPPPDIDPALELRPGGERRMGKSTDPVKTPSPAAPATPRRPEPAPAPHPVLAIGTKSGEELAARRRSRLRARLTVFVVASVLAGVLWVNRERAVDTPEPGVRPPRVAPSNPTPTPRVIPRDSSPPPPQATPTPPVSVAPNALAGNHARLADGLDGELARTARQIGLNGFLAIERLAAGDSVAASRAVLGRFVASLATYRAKQQALSKAYNDSADAFVLTGAWDRGALQEWQVRVRRPEPPAVVARADALMAGLDSVFGLLLEYRDGYEITAEEIRFQAPRASLQYDELFRAVNSNRVSQSERVSAPLTVLAQAMGGSRLPPSAHD